MYKLEFALSSKSPKIKQARGKKVKSISQKIEKDYHRIEIYIK